MNKLNFFSYSVGMELMALPNPNAIATDLDRYYLKILYVGLILSETSLFALSSVANFDSNLQLELVTLAHYIMSDMIRCIFL